MRRDSSLNSGGEKMKNPIIAMTTGKIVTIINHGSIIQVLLKTKKGDLTSIYFDHRCFENFYEGNAPLEDKTFEYDEETKTIRDVNADEY
jgi:hypothetical protein